MAWMTDARIQLYDGRTTYKNLDDRNDLAMRVW